MAKKSRHGHGCPSVIVSFPTDLEGYVLKEMSDAIVFLRLITTAGVNPNANLNKLLNQHIPSIVN